MNRQTFRQTNQINGIKNFIMYSDLYAYKKLIRKKNRKTNTCRWAMGDAWCFPVKSTPSRQWQTITTFYTVIIIIIATRRHNGGVGSYKHQISRHNFRCWGIWFTTLIHEWTFGVRKFAPLCIYILMFISIHKKESLFYVSVCWKVCCIFGAVRGLAFGKETKASMGVDLNYISAYQRHTAV